MVRAVDREDHTDAGGAGGSAPFDGYLEPDRPHAQAFDEMFRARREPRVDRGLDGRLVGFRPDAPATSHPYGHFAPRRRGAK